MFRLVTKSASSIRHSMKFASNKSFGMRRFSSTNDKSLMQQFQSANLKFIDVKESDSKLVVTMNRPDLHNAFNEIFIDELTNVFKTIDSNTQSPHRVVILTGNGPSFSAGADLNWMKKMATYTLEENERDAHQLFDMFHAIRKCRLPVVGKINGHAFGGGCGLVSCCDVAFSVSSAKFGLTEVKLGLIPAVISPFVIEKIGAGNAPRYFLSGQRFSADEARRIGLIQEHFASSEQLEQAITEFVNEINTAGPEAVAKCKQLISKVQTLHYDDVQTKKYLASQIAGIRVSSQGQAGIGAFLNSKKAPWVPQKK